MDRLTLGLVAVAVALGLLGSRDARRSRQNTSVMRDGVQPAAAPEAKREAEKMDQGMVVLRNDHIDDGIAVRVPFDGDDGIVGNKGGAPPPTGENR